MRNVWSLVLGLLLVLAGGVQAGENLLKNGALALENAAVAGWSTQTGVDTFAAETQGNPEGIASALRITVNKSDEKLAEMVQRIYPKGEAGYTLEGYVRSDVPGAAFLQVKLYKDKKEFKRINTDSSKKDWNKVTLAFATEGADKVEILCRWWRRDRDLEKSVWFAGLSLVSGAAPAAPAAQPAGAAPAAGAQAPAGAK